MKWTKFVYLLVIFFCFYDLFGNKQNIIDLKHYFNRFQNQVNFLINLINYANFYFKSNQKGFN